MKSHIDSEDNRLCLQFVEDHTTLKLTNIKMTNMKYKKEI